MPIAAPFRPVLTRPRRVALSVFLLLLLPSLARAAMLNVPSAAYPTIQAAVTAAVSGDTVLVAAGTYSGAGNRDIDFGGKNLTVMAQAGAGSTVIDCGGFASTDGSGNHRGFYIHSGETNAVISGFTVKNGYENFVSGVNDSEFGGVICIDGYNSSKINVTLADCTFTSNRASWGGGISCNYDYSGQITLMSCTINGNTAGYGGGGVYCGYLGAGKLTNCTISGNTAGYGGGVYNDDLIWLTNCTVTGNAAGSGGGIYNAESEVIAQLTNSIVWGDIGGEVYDSVSKSGASFSDVQGNYPGTSIIDANPLFVNAAYGDLHLKPGSPCVGAGTFNIAVGSYSPTDKDGNVRPIPPSIGAYEGAGSGGSGSVPQQPTGSLTLYDAGDYAAHTDLSNDAEAAVNIPRLTSDTKLCVGAVADGATKLLLRYNASAAGAVTFTETNAVSGDILRQVTNNNAPVGVATQLINGQNVAFAVYTVPESLDGTPEAQANPNHFTTHTVTFQAVFTPTGGATIPAVSAPLTLEDPPVLLIHGFASNPDTWSRTSGAWAALLAAGYPDYPNSAISRVDYRYAANDSFASNQLVPLFNSGGIIDVYNQYRANGKAITKVDVVAHSKGGLVTREFYRWGQYKSKNNFGKGYVRRVITLGTPHFGSPIATDMTTLANLTFVGGLVKDALEYTPFHYGDCYPDLEPGSQALSNLGTTLIPCYAEVGNYDVEHLGDLTSLYNILLFFGYNLHLGNSPSLSQLDTALFQGEANDGVVPDSSQEDALPSNFYHVTGFTNHLQECGSDLLGADVARLLTGPVSNFDPGFSAPAATAHVISSRLSPRDATPTAPFVTVTTPTAGQVFHTGDTLTVTVTPNTGATLAQVLIQAGASPRDVGSALLSSSPYTATFTVPANALGALPVTVTAKDNADNVCTVTVTAVVQTNATLTSLTVAAVATAPSGAALLTSEDSTDALTVTGTFSDATQSDITAAALGTTYLSSDPTVATVSADGVLTALANGNCTITVTNGSVTATENVLVQLGTPNILSAAPSSSFPSRTVSLALTGTDFGGAFQVQFLLNGAPDPNITVTNIQVGSQGTSLTATVTLAAGAAPGLRTITVTTPGGTSDALAAPDAAGFTVTPFLRTVNILWNNSNLTASVWTVNPNATFTSHQFGPFAGWTAKAITDSSDGMTRLLWNNTNGTASVWTLDNGSGQYTHLEYGPYAGWKVVSVSVGGDGVTHLLWDNANGQASLWSITGSGFTSAEYGPYAGWTANAVASGATVTDVMWTNTNGAMVGYRFAADGSLKQQQFGPYTGWGAYALSVGPDDMAHPMWDNQDGHLSLWSAGFLTSALTSAVYGPYSGWYGQAVATGSDNVTHLLWDNVNGQASLWNITNGAATTAEYGPYAGWTAVGVAAP